MGVNELVRSSVLPDLELGKIHEIDDVIRRLDYPEKMVA
jgi:hypothetical protein